MKIERLQITLPFDAIGRPFIEHSQGQWLMFVVDRMSCDWNSTNVPQNVRWEVEGWNEETKVVKLKGETMYEV